MTALWHESSDVYTFRCLLREQPLLVRDSKRVQLHFLGFLKRTQREV